MIVQRKSRYFSHALCYAVLCLLSFSSVAENLVFRDIAYGRNALQKLDIYQPANAGSALKPVHIFIHGD